MREGNPKLPNTWLCERMLSPCTLKSAIAKVKQNKGSAGVDGMKVEELDSFFAEGHFTQIREQILARKYRPKPVRRIEIPKDNGGVRLLGVPCVVDRVIQQAMVMVLQDVFEPTFSDFSYGFRPGRSAEDAVRQAQKYRAEGYKYVVDLDLSKFFDRVNHDLLMTFVDRTLVDKDIRRLIFDYLKAGVMIGATFTETVEGTPQGGPLSPLLSNIYLTPYDKELEKRGHKFVRYADDCNIFVKTKYSAKRVKESVIRFLEGPMKLTVNVEKTEARKFAGSTFLGFTFLASLNKENNFCMCRPKDKKLQQFKERIREITSRNRGVASWYMIDELNAYLRGWMNYYGRSNLKRFIKSNAQWIRRRVRMFLWKQWKTASNRKSKLRMMGVPEWQLTKFEAWSSNSYWKMSRPIGRLFTNKRLTTEMERIDSSNLIDIERTWNEIHERKMFDDRCNVNKFGQLCFDFIFD